MFRGWNPPKNQFLGPNRYFKPNFRKFSQYLRKYKSHRHKIWNIASGHQSDFVGGLKIKSNKIQDGGQPPFWKKENVHNSAANWDIFIKFRALMAMDSPQRPRMSFLGYNKIQDGGRPPLWKLSIAITRPPFWYIVTKFSTANNKIIIKLLLVKFVSKMINKTANIIDKNCDHFIKSCISRRSKTAKIIL